MASYRHDELEETFAEVPLGRLNESGSAPFDEMEEMALATELLEVNDDAELDQFLGKLLNQATRAAGRRLTSSFGRTLGGFIKGAVRQALPLAGSAAGNFPVPGIGGAIGGQIASRAGNYFGLELEGLSEEDGQYEIARRLVRFAGAAANEAANLAAAGPGASRPTQTVQTALLAAARQHAPGFIRSGLDLPGAEGASAATHKCQCGTHPHAHGKQQSGHWVRRGRKIYLLGA